MHVSKKLNKVRRYGAVLGYQEVLKLCPDFAARPDYYAGCIVHSEDTRADILDGLRVAEAAMSVRQQLVRFFRYTSRVAHLSLGDLTAPTDSPVALRSILRAAVVTSGWWMRTVIRSSAIRMGRC